MSRSRSSSTGPRYVFSIMLKSRGSVHAPRVPQFGQKAAPAAAPAPSHSHPHAHSRKKGKH